MSALGTFDVHGAMLAFQRLRGECTENHGQLVARFFLPLSMCPPRDRLRKERAWQAKERRDRMLDALLCQWRSAVGLWERPLPGRPHVICWRFSSVEPDATAGWGKLAVDCLQPGGVRSVSKKFKHPLTGELVRVTRQRTYAGLGLIRNDRPKDCLVREQWRQAPRGSGFCVVEVWTGASAVGDEPTTASGVARQGAPAGSLRGSRAPMVATSDDWRSGISAERRRET